MAQAPTQDFIVKSGLTVQGTSTVTSSTGNTSTLQVDGGAAIAKNLIVGNDAVIYGDLTIHGIVPFITVTTGTFTDLTVTGLSTLNATTVGVTTASQLTVNSRLAVGGLSELNNATLANQTNSTSTTSGALQVSGGVGIGKDLWVGGRAWVSGYEVLTTATALVSTLQQVTEQGSSTTVAISILNTLSSTSTNSGALTVAGGVGIGGDIFSSSKLYIGNGTATYANLTTATSGLYAARSINLIDTNAVVKVSRISNTNAPAVELQAVNTSGVVRSYWDVSVSTAAGGVDDNMGFRWRTSNLSSSGGADRLLMYGTGTALVVIPMTTATNSTATGAFVVKGGVGIGGGLYVGGIGTFTSLVNSLGGIASTDIVASGTLGVTGTSYLADVQGTNIVVSNTLSVTGTSVLAGLTTVTNTTSATSTNSGALQVLGGVGVGGSLYAKDLYSDGSHVLTIASLNYLLQVGTDTAISTATGNVIIWNTSTLQSVTNRGAVTSNAVSITNNASASSTNSGALQVTGGAGIGGNLYVGGTIYASVTGIITTSTNLVGGTAGQVPYQTAPGVTSFYGPGTSGNVLVSNGTGAPSYNNTLVLTGTTSATNTTTGALQVVGGVGIGGDLRVGGTIYGVASITGSITTATNLQNGTAGQVPYQSAAGVTNFYGPGTAGNILVSNGANAPTYNNTLTLTSTLSNTTTVAGNALQVQGGVGINGSLFVDGPAYFANNVLFYGTSTSIFSTSTVYTDNYIDLHFPSGSSGPSGVWTVDDGKDIGHIYHHYKADIGDEHGALIWHNASDELRWYMGGIDLNTATQVWEVTSATFGAFRTGSVLLQHTTAATSTTTGTLVVVGGVGIGGGIYVGGVSTFTNVINATSATFSGTLGVTGTSVLNGLRATNIVASGTLGVTGTTTLGLLNAGSATLSGTLGVTGTSVLNGLRATNIVASGTLGVTGTSILAGVQATNMVASGTLGVTGTSILAGVQATNIVASGTLGVTGTTTLGVVNATSGTFSSTLGVTGTTTLGLLNATSATFSGTLGVTGTSVFAGLTTVTNTTAATSTSTGALQVRGGVGIGGALYIQQTSYINGSQIITTATLGNYGVSAITAGTDTVVSSSTGSVVIWNTSTLQSITNRGFTTTNQIVITNATTATATNTGALTVVGGVGIGGALYVGGTSILAGVQATNIVASGTLGVTGTTTLSLLNATSATFSGTLGVTGTSVLNGLQATNIVASGTLGVTGTSILAGITTVTNITLSNSTNTGALQVRGGVGIGGNLNVGGTTSTFANTVAIGTSTVITTTGSGYNTGTISSLFVMGATTGFGTPAVATFQRNESGTQTSITSLLGPKFPGVQIIGDSSAAENYPGSLMILTPGAGISTTRGPEIYLISSRASTAQISTGTFSATKNGDQLGRIFFGGDQGTVTTSSLRAPGAFIVGSASSDWSSTSTEGSITFGTTPFGSTGAVDRVTISSSGKVSVLAIITATSTTTGALTVAGGVGIGGALYVQRTSYVNNAEILTTATLGSYGVSTITAGTDTKVSTSTGAVIIWNTGTLQTVTDRGAITTNQLNLNNGVIFGSTANVPVDFAGTYTDSRGSFIRANGFMVGTTTTTALYALNFQHNLAPVSTTTIGAYYGNLFLPTLQNTATYTSMYGTFARIDMAAAATSGTVGTWYGFFSANPSRNAAANVQFTNHVGFYAQNPSSITATNVYGVQSVIASGTNRYNIYASGTADNYFNGNVGIGGLPTVKLDVTGAVKISGITTVTNATTSISTTTGALIVAGGIGVGDSIYVENRVGFVNTSNVSVVYQVYNAALNSLDTVFG